MTRKVPWLGVLAGLALLAAFGCSLLGREGGGTDKGWCIQLQVQAPAGSKGITVTDFEVTGLNILVLDPAGEELQSIDWAAAQGRKEYVVPVSELGRYQVQVTHFGERDGAQVQATESAAFDIQAMKITVIDIVPGCIGLIRVEGLVDPNAWIYGFWVQDGTMGPDSWVLEIRAGTYTWWGDYFASRPEDIVDYGTWWIDGSTFHSKGVYGESAVEITKLSDRAWMMVNPPPGLSARWYRRGTEPGGWVFDQTPIPLSLGVPQQATLAPLLMDLYRFAARASAEYAADCEPALSWNVYAADQRTKLAQDADRFTLSAGQLVYVIVDSRKGSGPYALGIVSY